MNNIVVRPLTDQERNTRGIPDSPEPCGHWNVWNCEPANFDWHYDQTEEAYLYTGKVVIRAGEQTVNLKAGDFVTFPAGLDCSWEVIDAVSKVYRFISMSA